MQTSPAILIRLTKLTDTSLIVHWFTADHGLLKTAAKGARRPKSPFAGKLDLFFSAEINWNQARRSDLHYLREVAPTDLRPGIRTNYDATLLASYFTHVLELLVEPEHPEPQLHDLLRRALDHIDQYGPTTRALHHFEHQLAVLLGLAREKHQAASALRNALSSFPPQRARVLERLAPPQ